MSKVVPSWPVEASTAAAASATSSRVTNPTLPVPAGPRLSNIIRGLMDASVMYIGASLKEVPNLREEANHDHSEILEAVTRRDVEAATAAVIAHLDLSIRALEKRSNPARLIE